jgi:hypothetical protein
MSDVLTDGERRLAGSLPGFTTALRLREHEQQAVPHRDAVPSLEVQA